ncbi:MAG: ABC transporter ATP-binding protein [Verrucomicrobia bacterium]|nr:ABC transporter ATP-binding protein [Verrucomicrobiota bacterium]
MSRHPGFGTHSDPTFRSEPRPTGEVVRRVAVYLRPYRWLAVGTVGCAVLSLLFGLVYPKLTRFLIDEVIAQQRHEALTPAALGLLGAFFLREVFNSLRIRINNRLEQNVIFDMRRDVYGRMQRLPLEWFDPRASGDLMTRVIEDVNNVERLLIDGTEQGTVAVLSIIGALVFMFSYSPALAMVALIPMPFLVSGALWYTLTAHRRYRRQREAASAMNALLMDNLQGIRQIKSFGREAYEDERFAERADDLRRGTLVVMRAWAWYSPAMQFLGAMGICLVLWFGGRLVLDGRLAVGELVAFMLYAGMFFYEPIGRLHGLNQMLQSARAAAARVFDIMDAPDEQSTHQVAASDVQPRLRGQSPPTPDWRAQGEVEYKDVGFNYGPGKVALRDINLHAKPGEMIALVGPTGAGKSTLASLLPAFYEVTEGAILIDGYDIRDIPLPVLRAQISLVSQEAFLFNGTLRENIAFGRLDATEEEIIAAARAANCHDFIERLPEGYNSRVGERGVKLSVGEKQRVSIARALLKNAPILILDEATASVDTATEQLIQQALERLLTGRTSLVIAHRLSTIVRADQILVMLHGKIVERGTHQELLALNGLYAKLARIQNTMLIEEGFEQMAIR